MSGGGWLVEEEVCIFRDNRRGWDWIDRWVIVLVPLSQLINPYCRNVVSSVYTPTRVVNHTVQTEVILPRWWQFTLKGSSWKTDNSYSLLLWGVKKDMIVVTKKQRNVNAEYLNHHILYRREPTRTFKIVSLCKIRVQSRDIINYLNYTRSCRREGGGPKWD